MKIIIREFTTNELKKIVLKVVKQCIGCPGVPAAYVREQISKEFFRTFWQKKMAGDKRNYKQLIDTTIEIATKVGAGEVLEILVPKLKDENENFRKMVMETLEKIIQALGVADVDHRLETQLMDGLLSAFHEQVADESQVVLNAFGTIINSLGQRAKPYFSQIIGIINWRLNNKSARIRQ
jgi:splicing factor 3B subunit 1